MKSLCNNIFKSWKTEIEDYIRWKYLPYSWIDRINIFLKMAILPKSVYRVNVNPYQNPKTKYHRSCNSNAQLHMETNKTTKVKTIKTMLKNKRIAENIAIPISSILQSNCNKNSMILAKKRTHWSTESKWRPRHELMHIWTSEFW